MKAKQAQERIDSDRITKAVFEHAARISKEYEIEQLIQLNADFARDLVGADRCSLWLMDEKAEQLWTRVAHGVDTIRISIGDGLVGSCILNNQALIVNDTYADSRLMRSVDGDTGYHTREVMCIPLRAEGHVIGALQLLNKPGGFTSADESLLGLLAHFAGSVIYGERLRQEAIEANMLRRELSLARDVQVRLLPGTIDLFPGFRCEGLCRPARSIGGDYYDLLPLPDGRLAFTLGDVSGKGIPAAVFMASIQTLLRSLLRNPFDQLGPVMENLNQALYESSTADRYSTLFCGVISSDRASLRYVNAGQVAPFLLRRAGRIQRLRTTGLPVGLLPKQNYSEAEVPLEAGDLIVILSDGVFEVKNPNGDFWEEEVVEEVLSQHFSMTSTGIPEWLCTQADHWANGAEQYDDMTALTIQITEAA